MGHPGARIGSLAHLCCVNVFSAAVVAVAMALPAAADGMNDLPLEPVIQQPTLDWSGPYVGLDLMAGRSEGRAERSVAEGAIVITDVANGLFPDSIAGAETSTFGGLSLGYNLQRGAIVTGVELGFSSMSLVNDLGFSRVDPEILVGVDTITGYRTEIDNFATLSLRAGYAMNDLLLYGKAGVARADVGNQFTLDLSGAGIPVFEFAEEDVRWGYTVGVGVERMLTDRISITGEISYFDLEDTEIVGRAPAIFPGNAIGYTFDNDGFIASIGLTYAF